MKWFWTLIFAAFSYTTYAQVVISELDCDTPGADTMEFVELKTDQPNFPLDGYVLVFFNGAPESNRSYFVIDLDGLVSDINGNLLIGNAQVSPVPASIFSDNVIQNGPDAVAIYSGNASDFPFQTLATQTNLIDALVYGTSDPDATALMELLGVSVQIDENINSQGTAQSIQRKTDGTYEVKAPTPGINNDGTGFVFNGITVTLSAESEIGEGEILNVTISQQEATLSNLLVSFTLENGNFTAEDYSGTLSVMIPAGELSASTEIQIIDDSEDEGDEVLLLRLGTLPFGYVRLNDNLSRFVIDNDFTIAAWGTPLAPTYGIVSATTPENYYTSLEGKASDELVQAIRDIISDPSVVRKHTYGDAELMLKQADQNPLNSNQVWLMYVEQGRGKYKFQTSSSNVGSWNREHIFPQSRGGFSNATSSQADGIEIWETTGPDDIAAGHSDGHHLRAEDGPENTSRSNRDYGSDYNGPAGNQGSWKGDVARSLFYMAVRYPTLSLVNGNPPDSTPNQMGDLESLLVWNYLDPADDFEMNRNNVIYQWQQNRNPFIDHPELADYIWGEHAGEPWYPQMSTNDPELYRVAIWPNPSSGYITINGADSGQIAISDLSGKCLQVTDFQGQQALQLNLPSGLYLARVTAPAGTQTVKIVIR